MKLVNFVILGLCAILYSCSDEEPLQNIDERWIVEYNASPVNIKQDNKQSFLQWCNSHEDLIKYSLPSRELLSFTYENASMLKWEEYTSSEQTAQQKVQEFNAMFGSDDYSTMRAFYRKYDPTYNGLWRVVFVEMFYGMHNNSEKFTKWYVDNLPYLLTSSFLVRGDANWQIEYPSAQDTYSYYSKSEYGYLQWDVEIPNCNESKIKDIINKFQSFSVIDNSKNSYDTFIADYSPVTP